MWIFNVHTCFDGPSGAAAVLMMQAVAKQPVITSEASEGYQAKRWVSLGILMYIFCVWHKRYTKYTKFIYLVYLSEMPMYNFSLILESRKHKIFSFSSQLEKPWNCKVFLSLFARRLAAHPAILCHYQTHFKIVFYQFMQTQWLCTSWAHKYGKRGLYSPACRWEYCCNPSDARGSIFFVVKTNPA